MTNNNQYLIKAQIEKTEGKLHALVAHKHRIEDGLDIFRWVTLALYLAFTLSLYIGDIMHLRTIFESFVSSIVGFVLYLVIAIGLAYALAAFKHNFYCHRGLHGGAFAMVLVVMIMGLMAEVFQSGAQQDVKARAGAATSSEYQTLLQSNPAALLNGPHADANADKIIELQGELGRANELLRTCKNTCKTQRQKIAMLEGKISAAKQLQEEAAAQRSVDINTAQRNHADLLNQTEEKHYNPTIRAVKETVGVGIGTAVTLIMGFISLIFEICHAYFSYMYNQTVRSIEDYETDLSELKGEYADVTGTEYVGTYHPTPATQPQHTQPMVRDIDFNNLSPTVTAFAEGLADGLGKSQMARNQLHTSIRNALSPNRETYRDRLEASGVYVPQSDTVLDQPVESPYPTELDLLDRPTQPNSTGRVTNPTDEPSLTEPNSTSIEGRVGETQPASAAEAAQMAAELKEKLAAAEAEIARRKAAREAAKARLAEEREAARVERQRLEQEKAKLEAERQAAEQAAREADAKVAAAQAEAERLVQEAMAKAKAEAARAEAERQAAERARIQAAEAERRRIEAERAEREAAERQAAERARIQAAEAERRRIEAEREAAERAEREAAERQAAERARIQAAEAERRRIEAEREAAERLALLGTLTEDMVVIAANAIRSARVSGNLKRLGKGSVAELFKDAGLPRSSEEIKRLFDFACELLADEGFIVRNPNERQGVDRWLFA